MIGYSRDQILELLELEDTFVSELESEAILFSDIDGVPEFSVRMLERARVAHSLVYELGINLAGVAVILRLREDLGALRCDVRALNTIIHEHGDSVHSLLSYRFTQERKAMYEAKRILVPIDFSEPSKIATQRALMLAEHFGASIHLLHAVQDPTAGTYHEVAVPLNLFDTLREQAREEMLRYQAGLEAGGVPISAEVAGPDPVAAIRTAAEKEAANLIVMGTQGLTGLKHLFLGSVAERTLRKADCPVLVVNESESRARMPIRRILAATDFSLHSERATQLALDLSQAFGAEVDLIHVFEPPHGVRGEISAELHATAAAMLDATVSALEAPGREIRGRIFDGNPPEILAREAEASGADLIVMGTRGTSGLKHVFLGSVAERTLRLAPCSVLTTKVGDRW